MFLSSPGDVYPLTRTRHEVKSTISETLTAFPVGAREIATHRFETISHGRKFVFFNWNSLVFVDLVGGECSLRHIRSEDALEPLRATAALEPRVMKATEILANQSVECFPVSRRASFPRILGLKRRVGILGVVY